MHGCLLQGPSTWQCRRGLASRAFCPAVCCVCAGMGAAAVYIASTPALQLSKRSLPGLVATLLEGGLEVGRAHLRVSRHGKRRGEAAPRRAACRHAAHELCKRVPLPRARMRCSWLQLSLHASGQRCAAHVRARRRGPEHEPMRACTHALHRQAGEAGHVHGAQHVHRVRVHLQGNRAAAPLQQCVQHGVMTCVQAGSFPLAGTAARRRSLRTWHCHACCSCWPCAGLGAACCACHARMPHTQRAPQWCPSAGQTPRAQSPGASRAPPPAGAAGM